MIRHATKVSKKGRSKLTYCGIIVEGEEAISVNHISGLKSVTCTKCLADFHQEKTLTKHRAQKFIDAIVERNNELTK